MSGLRSSSVEGRPGSIGGGAASIGRALTLKVNVGRALADQHGDGVLGLRPLQADIRSLREGVVQLRLGLGHVGQRRRAAVEEVGDQGERLLVVLHGSIEQFDLGVVGPQVEVVFRQLRPERQLDRGQVGGACLAVGSGGRDLVAYAAPQVDFV